MTWRAQPALAPTSCQAALATWSRRRSSRQPAPWRLLRLDHGAVASAGASRDEIRLTDRSVQCAGPPRQLHPAHIRLSTAEATAHPAQIPREVAAGSRLSPAIPASSREESPALAGNPRLSPLSPQA